MNIKDNISLGFIYIGTIVGAGFATGQEIMLFFTQYGLYGLIGIFITSLLFFIFGYFVFKLALENQSSCIGDVLLPYTGKGILYISQITVGVFSLAGFYIMLTGCSAVLNECLGFPQFPVSLALGFLCILWLQRGVEALGDINKLLISIMLVLTFGIGLKSFISGADIWSRLDFSYYQRGWLFSAIIYFSYNMTLALVVIASLGNYTNKKKAALGAAFIGALGLFIMGSLLWFITTIYYPIVSKAEIPLLVVARLQGSVLYLSAIIILLSAMLTTALGLGFSFIKGVSKVLNIELEFASYTLLMGMPLAKATFSKLIKTIYPLFGIVGIVLTLTIVVGRFLHFKIE